MSKTVSFLNMFPDYVPSEPLDGMLSQAAITAADIDPEKRSVTVVVKSDAYIPQKLLQKAAGDICAVSEDSDTELADAVTLFIALTEQLG